jgi:hypothetical protein
MKQAAGRDNLSLISEALREAAGTDVSINITAGTEVIHAPVVAVDKPVDKTTETIPAATETKTVPPAAEIPAVAEPEAHDTPPTAESEADGLNETPKTDPVSEMTPKSVSDVAEENVEDEELEGLLNALGATLVEETSEASASQELQACSETMKIDL